MIDPNTAMRLLNDARKRHENGETTTDEIQRELKIIDEQATAYVEHMKAQDVKPKATLPELGFMQRLIVIRDAKAGVPYARNLAEQHDIDWRAE
ncbi:hypothetical protein P4E94_15725 [Pontiellaceae bacterium B12219]|nr:hypothetical protein [Pontiellaceae bacterium B12219]